MDINTRLEKLERENRRMKKIGIVAVVSCQRSSLVGKPDHPAPSME